MINLKDYRENPQKYIQGARDKGHTIDWESFDALDTEVRKLKYQIDELNAQRNTLSKQIQTMEKGGEEFLKTVKTVKTVKSAWEHLDKEYEQKYQDFYDILLSIPSPASSDVPVGTEEDNQVIKLVGEKQTFDFDPKPHREILEAKGYLDQERAVKISGSRFVIVKGKLAELQLALTQRVTQKLVKKWFELTIVPQLVREEAMMTTGFLPNEATNLYRVNPQLSTYSEFSEGPENKYKLPWEEDNLRLVWTSEVPLIGQHMNETFEAAELPKRYVWYSSCYRREAWTYGKDTKGLIRLHQFEKVEMVSFVKAEDAEKEHEMLFAIENEIFEDLWLHYQQILIASWDLGAPAAKKYDIEARFPGLSKYVEVTSTSNTTDYQTRRGGIKVKDENKKTFAFSLNGTAVALGRALACIVEQYQTAEGDIVVPEVLRKWMNGDKI